MQISFILQHFLRKKTKEIGKRNIIWPHECRFMPNTFSLFVKNPYVCKFLLENSNLKKLSKKHIEIAKTSPLSLELFMAIVQTSQWVLLSKIPVVWKKEVLKIWVGQICKFCAGVHNGLKAITKKVGYYLEELLLNIISMNVRNINCP